MKGYVTVGNFAIALVALGGLLESLLVTSQEDHRHRLSHPAGWLHPRWDSGTTHVLSWIVVIIVLVAFVFAMERHWFKLLAAVIVAGAVVQAEWGHDLPSPQNNGIFWAGFGLGALWLLISAMRQHQVFERLGRKIGLVT